MWITPGQAAAPGRKPRPSPGEAKYPQAKPESALASAPGHVSPGTVRKHLEHIYDKLEVRTRTEAAAIYTQERVVIESTGLGP